MARKVRGKARKVRGEARANAEFDPDDSNLLKFLGASKMPKLAGVPTSLLFYWLIELKAGRMSSHDQRQMFGVLLHKWTGKRGTPKLGMQVRGIKAIMLEWSVQKEIKRLMAAGPPPRRGYRAQYRARALDTVGKAEGWNDGDSFGRWLRKNLPQRDPRNVQMYAVYEAFDGWMRLNGIPVKADAIPQRSRS